MIAIGRALTGRMPPEEGEEDFKCYTCALSRFQRRDGVAAAAGAHTEGEARSGEWEVERPHDIPRVEWRGGRGVGGGWVCEINGDCSFLSGGEERGW